jgi:hypothetical protein
MEKQEWLECTDPASMLNFLEGQASNRKLRLFAVACCRRLMPLLTDPQSRTAVEIAEKYADGLASPEELACAAKEADAVTKAERGAMTEEDLEDIPESSVSAVAEAVTRLHAGAAAASTAGKATEVANWLADLAAELEGTPQGDSFAADAAVAAQAGSREVQVSLLHDLFGSASWPDPITLAWFAWNDGTVRRIAQAIYDERAFDRMPILADELEDAGCDNADILNHCRSGGEHVRGCWVVDLLLGKN